VADLSDLITPGTIAAISAVAVPAGRWGLKLWAEVRREEVAAAIAAAAKREAFETALAKDSAALSERMIEALLEQAKSSAAMAGKLDELGRKLDHVKVDVHERTPVEPIPVPRPPRDETPSERRKRVRTPLQLTGYRAPTHGGRDDNND
jgi:hypothetical protein